MVICTYFLRGTCRFGENCKNEHSYNDTAGSVMRKKQEDLNIIIKSVSQDMDKSENGNQWPFSCYGPFQYKPCFPGFEDKCCEEIRLGLYEAERNGTAEQYKQQLTQLINETRMKMRSLQNPTPEATNVLKELFNTPETPSANTFTNNSNSIFNNKPANQTSIFGNTTAGTQNVFASNTANNFAGFVAAPENKNIFANAINTQTSSRSIFTQNNPPAFSTSNNIFGGSPGKSIFSNTQQNLPPNTNIFQIANQNLNTNAGIFGNQQNNQAFTQTPTGGNIFAQNNPTTNQVNPFQQTPLDPFKQNMIDSLQQTTNVPFQQQNINVPFQQQNTNVTFQQQTTSDPFKQNTGDVFKQNVFQQQNTVDPFHQTTQSAVVHQPAVVPQAAVIHQSPFSANPAMGQNSVLHTQNQGTTNVLAEHTKTVFGSIQTNTGFKAVDNRQNDPTIYSRLEDLSEEDIQAFEAPAFEFGKIPEKPPTLQMCL